MKPAKIVKTAIRALFTVSYALFLWVVYFEPLSAVYHKQYGASSYSVSPSCVSSEFWLLTL
ncbi:hypothetical protein [uncultured Bacteroides sp.]|uniref:hypothetical protein n=1 Tax=uncultured Bacteroides sp. TaxID=162156 RepID=UPI0026769366|nr:hypothetical protein [uncultured Bacteroides sp.]